MRRFQRFRLLLLPSAFCLLPFLFSGCRKKETPVEVGNREQVFHIGNGAEPHDLDPHTASTVTEANILTALFEGLVILGPDGKTILPGAAERWEISADGKVYTFHLRSGLKWSNGDPLTSEDFLYSFRRIVEPKLASEMAIYANWVVGAQAYNEGKSTDLSAIGFRAPDPRTFEITLKERAPFWLSIIALNPFYPAHRASLEKLGGYLRRGGDWTRPGQLMSNGPFVLKEWRVNDSLTIEKNPSYWDAARIKLHAVVFHPIDDANAEERAFRGGLLHATRSVPPSRLQEYRQNIRPCCTPTRPGPRSSCSSTSPKLRSTTPPYARLSRVRSTASRSCATCGATAAASPTVCACPAAAPIRVMPRACDCGTSRRGRRAGIFHRSL